VLLHLYLLFRRTHVEPHNHFLGETAIPPMPRLAQGHVARIIDAMEGGVKSVYSTQRCAASLIGARGIEVQHIRSRVKHPQTGGKVARLFGAIKSKLKARWPDGKKEFRSLDGIVRWYNEVKPHEPLDFEHAETPAHAFVRKLRPTERTAYLKRLEERTA
jgi:hypothetical protein